MLEILEGRLAPAVYTVDSIGDAGRADPADPNKGDLRYCLTQANGANGNRIEFNLPGGQRTISLTSPLPTVNVTMTIDATTQPTFAGSPIVEIRGPGPSGFAGDGLVLAGGGDVVLGLIIDGFNGDGIKVQTRGNDRITSCYIGTDPTGMMTSGMDGGVPVTYSNTGWGINVLGCPNNYIGSNLLSGNQAGGVHLSGPASTNNLLAANRIGTNVTGNSRLPNWIGVYIEGAAQNTVGGDLASAHNLISGNSIAGILIAGQAAQKNAVYGNYIGTASDGLSLLPISSGTGVWIRADADDNSVGGVDPTGVSNWRNIISGNGQYGVLVSNTGTILGAKGNQIQSNYIGVGLDGLTQLSNDLSGVGIQQAVLVLIGGSNAGQGNVISGNVGYGISLSNPLGPIPGGNEILGNLIGTDSTGMIAVANLGGIQVAGADNTTIGGAVAGARNVISGNTEDGIHLIGPLTHTPVLGNYIGVNANGNAGLGNGHNGISVLDGANGTIIGGLFNSLGSNVISGNGYSAENPMEGSGIYLQDSSGAVIGGNFIGTDSTGINPIGNTYDGIYADANSTNNVIGGGSDTNRNVISGNRNFGIEILGATNYIDYNLIGFSATMVPMNNFAGMGVIAAGNTFGSNNITQ